MLVAVVFLCVAAWAWSGRRKAEFERAARIPLDDDDAVERPEQDAPQASPRTRDDG